MVTSIDSQEAATKLKSGWRMVRFGDVVRNIQVNINPEESALERYVAGEHMETDNLHIKSWGTIGDGYLGPAFHRKFVKGQVLYGSRRTYLRKVALADFDGICANTTFVLEADEDNLLQDLLPFIMQNETFTQHAIKQSRGSVNPYVNWKDIAWYEFALPPKDEQRRIADILWAADETIAKYNVAVNTFQTTRDTIRDEKINNLGNPNVRLADLCEPKGIQIGPFGSQLHASDYVKDGIPVIMPSDMSDDIVNESSVARITLEMADHLTLHKVLPGDILLPRRGELDRRVLILPQQKGWICGTGSIRIRVRRSISARSIFHALAAPQTVRWLQNHAVGTTMPNLNAQIVSNIPISLPSEQELEDIVQALETINEAMFLVLENIEKLKRLKKCFLDTLL